MQGLSENKYLLYAMLKKFSFKFHSDLLTGSLCVDLRSITTEQVNAYEKHAHALWAHSHHAHSWGWSLPRFEASFGLYSKYENCWPYRATPQDIIATERVVKVTRSTSLFHELRQEAEKIRDGDIDDASNFGLMMPVIGKRIRDKMGISLAGKRRDILQKIHQQNPDFCGVSAPLGKISR